MRSIPVRFFCCRLEIQMWVDPRRSDHRHALLCTTISNIQLSVCNNQSNSLLAATDPVRWLLPGHIAVKKCLLLLSHYHLSTPTGRA